MHYATEENTINGSIAAARSRGSVCSEMTALDVLFYEFLTGNLFLYNYVPEENKQRIREYFPQHFDTCAGCQDYYRTVVMINTVIEMTREQQDRRTLTQRRFYID